LTDLQGLKKCPEFKDLQEVEQKTLAHYVAQEVGFAEHIEYWFDGHVKGSEKALVPILDNDGKLYGHGSVLLAGPVGSGKTGYLSVMLKEVFIRTSKRFGGPAYQVPGIFLAGCLLLTHDELVTEMHQYDQFSWDELKKVKILLLDDWLSKTDDSKNFSFDKFYALIDYRYRNRLTTWISTNVSWKDIKKIPGIARIYSRLQDKSWMTYVEVTCKSRR